MARYVLDNKIYDTDKMQFIGTVKKWFKFNAGILRVIWGEKYGRYYDCNLYLSKKGNFLLTREDDCHEVCAYAITEDEAKELLQSYNYDAYIELYGELEEA